MNKKLAIVVVVGCLLILVNMGIGGVTSEETATRGKNVGAVPPLHSGANRPYPEETDPSVYTEEILAEETEVKKPFADAGGSYSGGTGVPIQFDGSHSYVGLIGMGSYEWDFGDGTNGYGKNPTHSYSAPGVYYTTLTIIKNNGETYQDIAPVYIDQDDDHLLPYGGCFYYAEKDEPILFDGSQSISNNPDVEISEWAWHFGDGTIDYGEQVTHSYSREKVYLVTLEIMDSNGCKRQDVLHADIGVSYSGLEDFFISSDARLTSILDILLNKVGTSILYPLLFVEIYTNYNGYEETIPLSGSYMLPLTIDVNHDGDGDVIVNDLNFFKPVIGQSPFNDFPWFAFETTISDIEKISEDITTDDNFTICLQFSLQIMEDFLGLPESIIRIGYYSAAGEEKPSHFTATHVFRPYILLRILTGGNAAQFVSQNINVYPVVAQSKISTTVQTTIQPSGTTKHQPLQGCKEWTLQETSGVETAISSAANEKIQPMPSQPYENDRGEWKLITENGMRLESSNAECFSPLISFSNVIDTTRTTLKVSFESFTTTTLMHRSGETCHDVDFQASDDSAVTLSITRENLYGSATLGLLINPAQSFGFHIDINKLANNGRHIAFNIDNPPENLILFAESEDAQGGQDLLYFYLRNIPTTIELEWLPCLDNGYITLTKEFASDGLEVGICDDLEDPYTNLYMTNLPTATSISWEISATLPRTITLLSDTDGLMVNVKLRDVTQENQTIGFHAISNEDLDIKFLWSLPDGYFELQRSPKNIDFNFSLLQLDRSLDITGNFQGGSNDGFVFNFKDFKIGGLEIINDIAFNVRISAVNLVTETSLNTDLEFITGGNIKLEWNDHMELDVDVATSIRLYDFILSRAGEYISTDEILLSGGAQFSLILDGETRLQLGGNGQVTVSQFESEIGYWSGGITSADAGGGFDILLKPKDKYYEVNSNHSIAIQGFDIEYDGIGEVYDMDFEIDSFNMYSGGTTWFDFSTGTPKFNFEGEGVIDVNNLHLAVGTGSSSIINFTISNAHVDNEGNIYGEWNNDYLFVDAEVNFNWDIVISTLNYGDWEAYGILEGSASMHAEWESGSGDMEFEIGESGLLHDLEIIHDDLTLKLGTFNFEPGTVTFEWQREQSPTNGYFNILNDGVNGTLTLCKITHDDQQNPFELKLGDITVESGDLCMEWSRQTAQKMIYIDNEMTVDMDLIKVTWGEKTVKLGDLGLNPGKFKFTWDTVDKKVTLNNGMQDLGPTLSYEDEDRKLSVSPTNLQDDYSKTMTLNWFEEQDGNISGVYLDTDGANLVDWIEFESIKYDSSGDTGRKIALGGLQADDFKIAKNLDNNLEVSGRLYLANHLTYSKLVSDEWKDLDIQWDLDLDGVGDIEFNIDSNFTLDLEVSTKFSGVNISTTFDLPQYLKFGWDVNFDGNGYVSIDTNGEEIYEIDFEISKDTQQYQPKWGLYIGATGLIAEDYQLSWDFTPPPGQWVFNETGYIEPGSINDLNLAWNGNWYNVLTGGTPI